MAPVIMGNPDRPELGEELTNSFCRTDPEIAAHFARVTFLSDNRADLADVKIADADPAVLRGRDRAAGRGRVRARADPRQPARDPGGDRALPEPERPGGDDRRHQVVPLGDPWRDRPRWPTYRRGHREDLYENAPCGYLSTLPGRDDRQGQPDLPDLDGLPPRRPRRPPALPGPAHRSAGRIYHETHYAPLLRMQGTVREIALELVCADGRRLPVLFNSDSSGTRTGSPR